MAYRKKTTFRSYRKKPINWLSKLRQPLNQAQSTYLKCRARGGRPRYCFRRAKARNQPWYIHRVASEQGMLTIPLPKPGFLKVSLRANERVVRYVEDSATNRQIYAPEFWVQVPFNATTYALTVQRQASVVGAGATGNTPTTGGM